MIKPLSVLWFPSLSGLYDYDLFMIIISISCSELCLYSHLAFLFCYTSFMIFV